MVPLIPHNPKTFRKGNYGNCFSFLDLAIVQCGLILWVKLCVKSLQTAQAVAFFLNGIVPETELSLLIGFCNEGRSGHTFTPSNIIYSHCWIILIMTNGNKRSLHWHKFKYLVIETKLTKFSKLNKVFWIQITQSLVYRKTQIPTLISISDTTFEMH